MDSQYISGASQHGESYDTIIIGGGQAGLAVGYYLKQRGDDFLILDEQPRTGGSWRSRWDSLRLFTPSQFDGLPGLPFPRPGDYFPTKDELGDYLEQYANKFNLPVQHGVKVERLTRSVDGFHIVAGPREYVARNVIVATGPYRKPKVPAFATELDDTIQQLHSSEYCNPEQIASQVVLVAGAGNSGAEIALELANAEKQVWLAGRDVGVLPIAGSIGQVFGGRLVYGLMTRILTLKTPMGRKMRVRILTRGHPLGRARRRQLLKAGVKFGPRVSAVESGKVRLEDGQVVEPDCIVWATGFHPDYSWIELPIFDEPGYPRHERGVVAKQPGLYFIGLPFQSAFNSSLLGGVGADAAYIAKQITANKRPAGLEKAS